jgi:hypothetical protein
MLEPGAPPLPRIAAPPGRDPAPPLVCPAATRTPPLLHAFSHAAAASFKNSPLVPHGKVYPHASTQHTSAQEPSPHHSHHRTTPGVGAPLPSPEWAKASPSFSPYPVSTILAWLFIQIGLPLNNIPSSLSYRTRPGSSPTTTAHRTPPPPSRTATRATSPSTH